MKLVKFGDLAPRPPKASFMRSLYDAVDALAGDCTVEEILEYIPSTDDADRWQPVEDKTKNIRNYLSNSMAHGYLVRTPSGRWRIAPIQFYHARQKERAETRASYGERQLRQDEIKKAGREKIVYVDRVPSWVVFVATGASLASLIIGFLIGWIVSP